MIQYWYCDSCNTYNDILREHCMYCHSHTTIHPATAAKIAISRGIFPVYGMEIPKYGMEIQNMTEQEQLFQKFFNHEKIVVAEMDMLSLRSHREELQKIAFEAKARVVAADAEIRERGSKNGNGQWLVTTNDVNVSDAINSPLLRAKRMSKMDKLKKQFLDAGIDEDTVKDMIRNLEAKATEKNIKTVTFTRPSVETSAVQVRTPVESEPFNPASLKFGE